MLEVYGTPRPLRSPKDPLFGPGPFLQFAEHLTGKRDMRSLYAECARRSVGFETIDLREDKAWLYQAILDGTRQEGVVVSLVAKGWPVVARMRGGALTADDPALAKVLKALIDKLPPTLALQWQGGARKPPPKDDDAPAKGKAKAVVALTAAARHELTTAAEAKKLSAVELAQLKAATSELSGKKTLPALWAWLKETDQSVVLLTFSEKKTPRWDAWLLGALEDGVFFEHGQRKLSGIAISQGAVSDTTKARRTDAVASLQAAMKKVRLPRRKR